VSRIDVNRILDSAPLRGLPMLVIVSTTVILILDGLDIQIISLVAPLLTREFHVTPASLGPALAAALIGMALGGFVLGGLGDRWGRRPTLLLSVGLFASATLLAATAHSIAILAAWRLLTGIGLGGAIPSAMALLAEFTGPRWRTAAIAAAVIGVPIGGMIGASIAGYVLPHLGWRTMFFVGGLLPCIALIAIYFILPESPRFLATRPERHASLVKVLRRLAPSEHFALGDDFELSDGLAAHARVSVSTLVTKPLLRETLGIWLIFFTNMFTIFTFFSWSPVILGSFGLSLSAAVRGSFIFNLAGVCGGCIIAWMLSRLGSRWPTAAIAALGVIALWTISRLLSAASQSRDGVNLSVLMTAIAMTGFVMIGIQTAAYRLSAHLYPTQIRSSGVGWAAGFGRLGGILSSLIAGWLLAQVGGAGLFAILSGAVALTLLGILLIRDHLELRSETGRV
jgi:MFS transporter, AAHS family, 4-hydroxybenzoate transporter